MKTGIRGEKTTQLRALMEVSELSFLMEAHNGISAKIVEESGFCGIWASGLTMSASLGLRDNNELSMTQVLEMLEYMSDQTEIPILLDGDTGYGNFNQVRRLIQKLEQRGIAGVCLEDKLFPKTNSFIAGEKQPMAEIEEFCGKIKAAKDTQLDDDFCVVARTEAFITGWGAEEALKRARAYAEAGADAILVHSKRQDASDIESFMNEWDARKPIIIVPTKYYQTPVEEFAKMKISVVIWANHLLRAAVTAMQNAAKTVHEETSLQTIEPQIAPVSELFRLQNAEEYNQAEHRYLPQSMDPKAIILAASRGENFGTLTEQRPKCMLKLAGKPLIQIQESVLHACGIRELIVVVGYKKEAVRLANDALYLENKEYETTTILSSLYTAKEEITGPCLITFGDITYEKEIILELINDPSDIVLAIDTSWYLGQKEGREMDLVICDEAPSDRYLSAKTVRLTKIGIGLHREEAHGEWMGVMKLSSRGAEQWNDFLTKEFNRLGEELFHLDVNDFLAEMMAAGHPIYVRYFRGRWLDVDSIEDLVGLHQDKNVGDSL